MAELEAYIRPRPIRIAFLVEDGDHADLVLDGVFSDSYARWGGRFSLVVPCTNGIIAPAYWPWLEAYDPDVVYSYVALPREAILEVHDRLNPAEYIARQERENPRLDVHGFKPDYRFKPLASLSTIFRQARYSQGGDPGAPVKILDCYFGQEPSRFLSDNFGTYVSSFGTSLFPPDGMSAASLKTIIDPDIAADRRRAVPRDLDAIPNELEGLRQFTSRQASSLSMASLLFAPKLDFRTERWSGAFNLVVGSSFADRILYWNARLLIPSWLDTDLCCLRVEPEQLDNPDFLAALGDFLKHRNRVNSGAGGQSELVIRSMSLTAERLEEIRTQVLATRPWCNVRTEVVQSLDDIVPSTESIQSAREGNRFGGGVFQRPDRTRFVWNAPTLRPPLVDPDHLSDAPPRQHFVGGYWASDLDIELDEIGPGFSQQNRWYLPRHWRLAGAFSVKRADGRPHDLPPVHRRGRDGTLTVFMCGDAPIESIVVPSSSDAIYHALSQDGRWAQDDVARGRVHPPSKVSVAEPSNEARYLTGVLGLADGLDHAAAFLLHPFLTDLFGQLGGTPNPPDDKVRPTINALRKRTDPRQATFNLRDENERSALAHLIVRAASGLRKPKEAVSFRRLKEHWAEYRAKYWEAHPQPRLAEDDRVDWDARETESLEGCLIEMRRRRMVFQGHRWVCQECHHQNWIDLDSVGAERVCGVCKTGTQTPIDIDWLFRPNEFLIECLRDRSALSLVWVLSLLRQEARSSFYYAGPTRFFYSYQAVDQNRPDAEADLLVVADGRALLCEVKSSWSIVTNADIRKLVELAQRLRPDVAVLAVMDEGEKFADELTRARTELRATGIEFRLLVWHPDSLLDGPYLPTE